MAKGMYIRLAGISEEANQVINEAIELSGDSKCENVSCVHLFLAILKMTGRGKSILNNYNTSYDEVFDKFNELVKKKVYGYFDSTGIEIQPEHFSQAMLNIIMQGSVSIIFGHAINVDDMLKFMLENQPKEFIDFLDYVGMSVDGINSVKETVFTIPEFLQEFVQDVSESDEVKKYTYVDNHGYSDEMIKILGRKKKANPCLVGDAGVGKTSAVYALVQRMMRGQVPDYLKKTKVVYVNGTMLISGTRFRGDFEERLKGLMEWASETDCIIFLDEMHTFLNSDNTSTAGNMIKKYLSDGSIKVIGATTVKEYHKYIEKDTAFDRRMQRIDFKEPSKEETINMINQSLCDYEEFHGVDVPDELIETTVNLADKYMKGKFFPDKAFTILDQACVETKVAGKKKVSEKCVYEVVSKIAGVNTAKMKGDAKKNLLSLEDILGKRVIGQAEAVKVVSKAIRRSRAEVNNKNKPLASFIFVGPTGVGKTELCRVLSEEVAIGDAPLIKIDMSEYAERYDISKMIGSAPGFVGYGEGGQLTEKVKHNPYSIVLFDEIEKAHPDVFNIFLQILDEGKLTDGEGVMVDFTNCIIVMTSNAGYGADGMSKKKLGFNSESKPLTSKEKEKIAKEALEATFRPELLNRLDNIVIFESLDKETCKSITRLSMDKLADRLKANRNIQMSYTDGVVDYITENGYSGKYGARNINREIQDSIEDKLADLILSDYLIDGCSCTVDMTDEGEVGVVRTCKGKAHKKSNASSNRPRRSTSEGDNSGNKRDKSKSGSNMTGRIGGVGSPSKETVPAY